MKEACNSAHLIIEAVYEHLLIRQEVFGKLESAAPESALLASNTSTLTVTKIGSKLSKKNRLLGMHFFNPAQITKLVEIVKTDQTSVEAIQKAGMILETTGKTPNMERNEQVFIANC